MVMKWKSYQHYGERSQDLPFSLFPYSELFSYTVSKRGSKQGKTFGEMIGKRLVKLKGLSMRLRNLIALSLLSLFVTSCVNSVTSFESFCSLTEDHMFSDETIEAMTREELLQELNHNELREKYCS